LLFYPREIEIVCARKSWIAFGAGKHFRYIAAHELAAALGGDKTRNKSITSKAMQYRQDIVTRTPITRVELITILA